MSADPRHYPPEYDETVVLRDARLARLRLLGPDDKGLLTRTFERLSERSRYQRFFAAKATLSAEDLSALPDCDGENHLAITALSTVGGDGVGVARFIRTLADPAAAEAAIAVIDSWQRCGLGTILLVRLFAAAAERGIDRLVLHMLSSNTSMAALVRKSSPRTSLSPAPPFGVSAVVPVGRASR